MIFLRKLAAWKPWRTGAKGIRGCLTVLPILRAQLAEVSTQVEQAVVSVCSNFSGIAERSRTAVAKAGEMLKGSQQGEQPSVEQSIETSRATIASLLDRLERAGTVSTMVVTRMEQVEKSVGGIESLLAELQKIAFSNKLVALNAKIEAVHVGALGAGFEVVADEISRQGERSNELAENIGERVREMRDRVNSAADDLRAVVAEDTEKLRSSRGDAEAALQVLCSVHERAQESMALMVAENSALAQDIAAAVVGLQFQDRTCQRLTHVIEALQSVEENLGQAEHTSSSDADRVLLDDVRGRYTMDSERAVLERVVPGTAQEEMQGGDVELF